MVKSAANFCWYAIILMFYLEIKSWCLSLKSELQMKNIKLGWTRPTVLQILPYTHIQLNITFSLYMLVLRFWGFKNVIINYAQKKNKITS